MVVTFYSFKGGVGRSMALANVSEVLANLGYDVVVCDWDLEAPGLERYYSASADDSERLAARPGLMDLLLEYKELLRSPADESEAHEVGEAFKATHTLIQGLWLRRPSSYSVDVSASPARSGSLRLLTSGARDAATYVKYAEAVRTFDWQEFYDEWAGGAYIDFLRRDLSKAAAAGVQPIDPPSGGDRSGAADILLVDSRTGVTEHGGVCTHHLADFVVLLSAANDLNLQGIERMARALDDPAITERRAGRPLSVLPVPTRIEQTSEKNLVNVFRMKFAERFARHLPESLGTPAEFFQRVEIPYMPFYSFTERVAAREPLGERDPNLYRAYEVLAGAIVDCGVRAGLLREAPPSIQWASRPRVAATRADLPRGLYLLRYSPENRPVAETLLTGLTEEGLRVIDRANGLASEAESRQSTDRIAGIILLVGPQSPERWVRAEFEEALRRQALQPEIGIFPLLQSDVALTQVPYLNRVRVTRLPTSHGILSAGGFQSVIAEIGTRTATALEDPSLCPFAGLRPLDENDARFFYGRDGDVAAVAQLGATAERLLRWLQIQGPSGVGKSSFVRAGLFPAIRRGELFGGFFDGHIAVCRLGPDPVASLASALFNVERVLDPKSSISVIDHVLRATDRGLIDFVRRVTPAGQRFVLFVDQLEELLQDRSSAGAGPFAQLIITALQDEGTPLFLLTALRTDFIGRMERFGSFAAIQSLRLDYELRPLNADQFLTAGTAPARLAGLRWEQGLLERIVADAVSANASLPLFTATLRELWERRSGNVLTDAAYRERGGLIGDLIEHATQRIRTLSDDAGARARRLLLSLIKVGRNSLDTGRTISRDEAIAAAGGGAEAETVLSELTAPPALVTIGADERVQIAHEVLIRQWGTLRAWVDQDRAALEVRDELDATITAWKAAGERIEALPHGRQLAYFLEAAPAGEEAKAFLDRARQYDRRLRWRAVSRVAAQVAALVAVAVVVWAAWNNRQHESRDLAEAALRAQNVDPLRGLVLALEAAKTANTQEAQDALKKAIADQYMRVSVHHDGPVTDAVFSPDGRWIATSSEDKTARVWDAQTGQPRFKDPIRHEGSIVSVRFSRDGQLVATASLDNTAGIWDASTGKPRARLRGHSRPVVGAEFSPDGRRLVTAGWDARALVWEVVEGSVVGEIRGHTAEVTSAVFSPDGRWLLTAGLDGIAVVSDATFSASPVEVRPSIGDLRTGVFSPDSSRIALGGSEGWAVARVDGRGSFSAPPRPREPAASIAFEQDGAVFVTVGPAGVAVVSSDASGSFTTTYLSASSSVVATAAAFSPKGDAIVVAGIEGVAAIWSRAGQRLMTLRGHEGSVRSALFSPDGRSILTASNDSTAAIWDVERQPVRPDLPFADLLSLAETIVPRTLTADQRLRLTAKN